MLYAARDASKAGYALLYNVPQQVSQNHKLYVS